jgi:molybdenum cofactor cytidylyltransferase
MHIHAILLAAGSSSRFGAPKQLATLHGKALVLHALQNLSNAHVQSFRVILGANAEAIKQILPPDIKCVEALDWEQGMSASIAAGADNLPTEASHLYIGLADQVEITTKQCNLLIETARQNPQHIIASRYQKEDEDAQIGAPAIFPSSYFQALRSLGKMSDISVGGSEGKNPDKGAKALIEKAEKKIIIDINEAAYDIDTQQDLERLALKQQP